MAENLFLSSQHTEKNEIFEGCCSTQIGVVKLRHTWTVNNFPTVIKECVFESPTFSARGSTDKSEWCLVLVPNTDAYNNCEDYFLSCCLKLVRSNMNSIQAMFKLRIVNAKGKYIKTFEDSQLFIINRKEIRSNSLLLNHWDLFDLENEIFEDECNYGKLDIFCEIIYKVSNGDISKTLNTPQSALTIDFTFLLQNKQLSDVTLCVSGREFPAHMVILSAQSPVFRAMFQCDMVETKNNRVEITDIDEESLGEMLRFMYTGKINKLKEMAPQLLSLAETYQLDELKIRCEEEFLKNLSLENAVEFFILSDTFRATHLKFQVKKFIKAQVLFVVIRPEFQTMVQTHPHLAIEICCFIDSGMPRSYIIKRRLSSSD